MAITQEAPNSQTMRALLALRELILSGEFGHGDRMSELPLVERLGVSRTPVRLALAALEHEGLLRALPSGGYVVREFTASGHRRRDRAARGARGHRGALCRRTRHRAARAAGAARAQRRDRRARETGRLRVLRAIRRPQRPLPRRRGGAGAQPPAEPRARAVTSVPFASSRAFVATEAELPESRTILVIAHNQHQTLIDAIEAREGARAESIAREHARIAGANLQLVLRHRGSPREPPGPLADHAARTQRRPSWQLRRAIRARRSSARARARATSAAPGR